ncbi:MAG: FkbM family methyltransferase [Treponema sp.]|nr:FkbM family methyltransferase [Treponema sp.]
MGIRHSLQNWGELYKGQDGRRFGNIPVPDDGFHAETIEYVSCFTSIENAGSTYTMFELGAGWGPWMSIAGVAAKTRGGGGGKNRKNHIGVEGEHNKIPLIKRHLTENGLRPASDEPTAFLDNVHTTIYDGVINATGKDVAFPVVNVDAYGASLAANTALRRTMPMKTVKGYSFNAISRGYDIIDFVHLDLQGYEMELLESCIKIFSKKVKYLFIGTHTRKIEGDLVEFLYNHGWTLLREQPCVVQWPKTDPGSFVNVTVKDGGQFWKNRSI